MHKAGLEWSLPLARGRTLRIDRTLVMGILNVTPDSFSDGGRFSTPDAAVLQAKAMLEAGADLLDIGGESTRPGATPVPAELELQRVLPAIAAIRQALGPARVLSIDTKKAVVAQAAIAAGGDLVNDVSGLGDPAMAEVVRQAGCCIVLMRNQPLVGDPLAACAAEFRGLLQAAQRGGIRTDQVILDPGLGFGDPPGGDPEANMILLRAAGQLGMELGRPVLVGASRKRFIGRITGIAEPATRVTGSVEAAVQAARAGAAIVRVHDVAETVQALRVAQA